MHRHQNGRLSFSTIGSLNRSPHPCLHVDVVSVSSRLVFQFNRPRRWYSIADPPVMLGHRRRASALRVEAHGHERSEWTVESSPSLSSYMQV
jgi:hypothetical protein